ncbi:unnamed protein product [Lupinus luteus]|uniref:Cytochrome P450 n=1 Tax=Lupinus luteus TaxID=3873 RepID=A0AAV1Y612_LUPLU
MALSSYHNLIFTFLAFFISCLLLFLIQKTKSKRVNLPPGPLGWPIVGNLFQFANSGKPFFEYVNDNKQKYGPIFSLKFGTRTMIIISDAKLIHEALIEKGATFASRPRENPTRLIFSENKFTVNAATYGPVWRSLRKNMVQNMLSTNRLKEFRAARYNAMNRLIERLKNEAEVNNGVVWVLKDARFAVFCILVFMCFGLEMDEETLEKMDKMMKLVLATVDPRIDDYVPILSPFFSKQKKRALEVRKEQFEFIVPFIEQRRRAIQNPDTTATAIEWGIAQLITNPDIQSKLFDEIKETVGDRTVDETDIEKMHYLRAVVKELLRKHPPTYLSLTHAVTKPAKLSGYDIPTDANVEFFLPPISMDPNIWSNPEKFNPDRFLTGREDADMTGVTGVRMMPFGIGRRICPGLGMATLHVHLMLARMVQEFEWNAYPKGKKLDFTGKCEFTVVMKEPLRAMIKPRLVAQRVKL